MAVLRNVAKTDTLEVQRQKLNLIANDLYGVLSGSSDIEVNKLFLQNGSKNTPPLSFSSDQTLGFYKSDSYQLSFVSNNVTIVDLSSSEISFKKTFKLDKTSLSNTNISIDETGSEYTPGTYNNITLYGGSGFGAEANIVVTEYIGNYTENNYINKYKDGSYTDIPLTGGSGTGSLANFTITTLSTANLFEIKNGGSGYIPGTYNSISLTGGSGSGKIASIEVTGNVILDGLITNSGSGYINGLYTDIDILSVPTNTYSLDILQKEQIEFRYGTKYEWNVVDNGLNTAYTFSGYSAGDNIFIQVQQGDILTFNINSPGHPFWISLTDFYDPNTILPDGVINNGTDNGTIILDTNLVQPGVTYYYICQNHPVMAGQILVNNYSGGEFSVGDILTVGSVSGTTSHIDNFTDIKVARFSTISGGSFSIGDLIQNIFGITAIVYSNQQNVNVYTTSGNELNISFEKANSYRLNTSSASNSENDLIIYTTNNIEIASEDIYSISKGSEGQLNSFTNITISPDVVESFIKIKPSGPNSGYSIIPILSTTTTGNYIIQAKADVEVDLSNQITSFTIVDNGINYEDNITTLVEIYPGDIGGSGSGFEYSINDIVYTGVVSNIQIDVNGSGYQENDILSINSSDIGGQGSDFELLLFNTKSITPLTFTSKGINYEVSDLLYLPESVDNISTTLDISSTTISVSSTSGIYENFVVTKVSGDGNVDSNTYVIDVVDSTTLVLSSAPLVSGSIILKFTPPYGAATDFEWQIEKLGTVQSVALTNLGDGYEENDILTVNREDLSSDFGPFNQTDNLNVLVNAVTTTNLIKGNILSGELSAIYVSSPNSTFDNSTIDTLNSTSITTEILNTPIINSTANLDVNIFNEINLSCNKINIGPNISLISSSGNITTTGRVSVNSLNVSDVIVIDSSISSTGENDIIFTPPTGRVTKVNSATALVIPSGSESARPQPGVVQNGSIRYNTTTNQYEGYSESTSSWSSLGGVRDLDGNTYILAEQFTGANDDILYFYNDNQNTIKLSPFSLNFETVKTISSSNISAPTFTNWTENTPVTLGQYLRYRNNIYVVSVSGVTSDSTNPPTHSIGSQLNGTAELTWNSLAVDDLTFDGIKEVKIGPFKNTPLVVSEELKLLNDTISTLNNDLKIQPSAGKKTIIDSSTSLVIPSGNTSERGIALQGGIRYNSQLSSFEGYNGANWTSLGGVKDVDGNTYIIPETAPGANENILYFYNDNDNTIQVSKTAFNFKTIDAINSDSNNLDLNVSNLSLNNDITSLSVNSSVTKLQTTSNLLELGVSSGLNNDTILKLDDTGSISFNNNWGTGSPQYIKLFNNSLTEFELNSVKTSSSVAILTKGTTDSGLFTIFDPAIHSGAKVVVLADNTTTNSRELIEYTVISKGSDIFHTEYGNVITGSNLILSTFDFDASGNVRLTTILTSDVTTDDVVNVTSIVTIIKK
jgi:hypothetical protein